MGAIYLYRGNLHRPPDVPRRWLMPNRQISLKDFKTLLHRRSRALARRRFIATSSASGAVKPGPEPQEISSEGKEGSDAGAAPELEPAAQAGDPREADGAAGDANGKGKLGGADFSERMVEESLPVPGPEATGAGNATAVAAGQGESQAGDQINPNLETSNKVDGVDDKEKRKKEVEEKLQVLNGTKHNLVQVLKQIQNAEEELKRRNTPQAIAGRPPVPLNVDVVNDPGSKHVASKLGSDGNLSGDMEGAEADDISNHNMHSRHLFRMSSLSPSSESPHKRPALFQHNVVPHPSRANLGSTSSPSPSRFAPTGHHGHPANQPTVSLSGTYIASSPSPAGSGGTSAFKDARLPSPWN